MQESGVQLFLRILIWAICFVAVGLVSLWAALGDARPLRRGPAVFILPPALGAYLAVFAMGIFPVPIMVLYPMALMGSLLVVRSCGYRLVRRDSAEWIELLSSAQARQKGSPLPPFPSHRPVG